MRGVVRFTVAQTVLLNIVFVLLVGLGTAALMSVPVERYPGVQFGKCTIQAFYPGASPEEVQALVTRKIEEAIEDVDNIEYIRATSEREYSRILVKFIDDTDYDQGFDDLRLAVFSAQRELPATVDAPQLDNIETSDVYPVVTVNLRGDRKNRALVLMAEDLESQFRQIPGVRQVNLWGEYEPEFHILLAKDALIRHGITFDQVSKALQEANINLPAGDLTGPEGEWVMVVDERFRSRDQIAAVVVRHDASGDSIRVGDLLHDAYMTHREPNIMTSVNGDESVSLQIIKQPTGNALDIMSQVKQVLSAAEETLNKEGVEAVLTWDSTVEINDALFTLGWNLFIGVVLVSLLIWFFMGIRNAGLTVIGIPFAFLVTMIFLELTGNSLNEITLFSFVLISGIVVDDAIVVVENIYRHFQAGKKPVEAVVDGTAEVFLPVLSVTLTSIAAFLPMLLMTGYTGDFFAQIPKAVSFALAASVLECLFILPIHFLEFGPRPDRQSAKPPRDSLAPLRPWLTKFIHTGLRHRFLYLGAVALMVLITTFMAGASILGKMPILRVKFFPEDYNRYLVDIKTPPGTPLEATSSLLRSMSETLSGHGPAMTDSVVASAGYWINEDWNAEFGRNIGQLVVTLPPQRLRRFADYPTNDPLAHLAWVREALAGYQEEGLYLAVRPLQDGPPTGKDINVRTLSKDRDRAQDLAREIENFLQTDTDLNEEIIELNNHIGDTNQVFRFHVREDKAAEWGVSPAAVAGLTAAAVNGRYIGAFRERDEEMDIKLRIAGLDSPEDALAVPLIEHPQGAISLGDLNDTSISRESASLDRFQGLPSVALSANLREGSSLSPAVVVDRVRTFYRGIQDQYAGVTISFAGEFDDTRRSFASLGKAFVVSLFIIYLILATQFRSYVQPFLVLSAIPFAFIGVVLGIFLTRSLLTINSLIAMVGVAGIVVNDALVLIEFINKRYRETGDRLKAIHEASQIRLRPILLTTVTTTLAFLPMALGIPSYSIVWGSMASTFVTGLCTATFLTLVIIPILWDLIIRIQERIKARKRAAT